MDLEAALQQVLASSGPGASQVGMLVLDIRQIRGEIREIDRQTSDALVRRLDDRQLLLLEAVEKAVPLAMAAPAFEALGLVPRP